MKTVQIWTVRFHETSIKFAIFSSSSSSSRKVLGPIMSIVTLYKTMYTCVKEESGSSRPRVKSA